MSVIDKPRHRLRAESTGGAAGNERLTALTGAVLLVVFAAEGVTILRLRELLTLHFFLGMLLLGPVTLKIGSTAYRFARYYTGAPPYVRKGPPAPLLRVLGPLVIATSVAVIGTGVVLAITGPQAGPWLFLHKASFVLWFAVMTIHVLWYAPRLPRLLASGAAGRTRQVLAGAATRWLLLAAALGGGLVVAVLTMHMSARWGG
ncbi:MAG TPA: hypothetical protein VMK13_08325 [Streptosporangiaceae bacterium]|nr:hypothetical protein [Streptosporangiaceae bacterium]